MPNPFESDPASIKAQAEELPTVEQKPEQDAEKTKPFDLKFYVTDHSADNANTGSQEELRKLYDDIQKDGIVSVRYDWRWNRLEEKNGEFDEDLFERYEQAPEIMKEAGLEPPTIILSSIPTWALELYKKDKEQFFEAYREYVEEVKERLVQSYKKTGELISRVQVLNELNNVVYTPIDGYDLPRLCTITREVLHDYNPDMKLMGTIFAGNLPEVIKKMTLGKVNLGIPIEDYLKKYKEALDSFDVIAVDYYPGMWHVPVGEAHDNKKEIFKQLGLLQKTMEMLASYGKEYELGEIGIQTNMPLMNDKHNQDRQRYFYDVFFREFKQLLLDFQRRGIQLPTHIGLYEAIDEAPKSMTGKILRKLTPFPEHDMGIRKTDMSRKEILQGNRHAPEKNNRGNSQLSKIIKYMNTPVKKD